MCPGGECAECVVKKCLTSFFEPKYRSTYCENCLIGNNSKLNLKFERSVEGTYFSIPDKSKKTVDYDYYSYVSEEDMSKFFLVKNKQKGSTLFSDRDRLDFFLVLRDNFIYDIEDLILDLRKIRGVIAVFSFSSSEFEFSEYLND